MHLSHLASRRIRHCLLLLWLPILLAAQKPEQPGSGQILHALQKLNTLGSVLYVAAHPDDENTRLISHFVNERHLDVTYLSLTRGDGGQNLIGPEMRELLGVIRTQELLAARRTDGGRQMFTRANDFGFSKSPEETLTKWDRDSILSDVVWAIRQTRPDIVINRFSEDPTPNNHGHHTASAILCREAFGLADRKDAFPAQLASVQPFRPQRLFFNTSWWFYGSRENFEKADKSDLVKIPIGTWYPLLGLSNNELAARSRSKHRCQGFGSEERRGEDSDYLKWLEGKPLTERADPLEGIDLSWNRVAGGPRIGQKVDDLIRSFNPLDPSASLPALLATRDLILNLPDAYWREKKLSEIDWIIQACLGLYVESTVGEPVCAAGSELVVRTEIIQRSSAKLSLESLSLQAHILDGHKTLLDTAMKQDLRNNAGIVLNRTVSLPANAFSSQPYWLRQPWSDSMYVVGDRALIGRPENEANMVCQLQFQLEGRRWMREFPVTFKKVEPAIGEIYQPLQVVPPLSIRFTQAYQVFPSIQERTLELELLSQVADARGTLTIQAPPNWVVSPQSIPFEIKQKGGVSLFQVRIRPEPGARGGKLQAQALWKGQAYDRHVRQIAYEHIPTQVVLLEGGCELAYVPVQVHAKKVGYIMGAGDEIPEAIRQLGVQVDLLSDEYLLSGDLNAYDALVAGIRAYNTRDVLKYAQARLFEYVNQGGTYVVQYNNNFDLVTDQLAPFDLTLSRDRVTEERAPVEFLIPDHVLLQEPNRITEQDFAGWMQERGLYFPGKWAPEAQALLGMKDSGEPVRKGALIFSPWGKGRFIYTGLSFFRQLPAVVPGAYRLFANLLSRNPAKP